MAVEQVAVLPDHRLTFACGGLVNAVEQRGYEIYGLLLRFDSHHDWQLFKEFDTGYSIREVWVYPLSYAGDPESIPIRAFTFVFDPACSEFSKENCRERLPQQRYLELIASGMREYGINEEYVEDNIMSVPYSPRTKQQDFKTFPQRKRVLPLLTVPRYQYDMCRNAVDGEIYFVIGRKVISVDAVDNPSNPCAMWLRHRAHGLLDITLTLHRTVVDCDLPTVDDSKDITPLHIAWAENHMVEWMRQSDLVGRVIFELLPDTRLATIATMPRRILSFRLRRSTMRTSNTDVTIPLERRVACR